MILFLRRILKDNRGLTLIEMLIVVTIIAILSMVIVPRISSVFDSRRSNFIILTTMIAKTFDDSFVNDRTNFLLIHLYESMDSSELVSSGEEKDAVFSRPNGVSVVVQNENANFTDSPNKLLQYKNFSDSFRVEEVLLSTGVKISAGNVLIPFYPAGQSDNVILHVLVNNEENWSLRIYKLRKEPEIFQGYINFSGPENGI
jgi:prepilin-type N-terminal cleavage/methylation domain-containing protein